MSRYNTIIKNDVVNGKGVCTSFFVQGCPHHCPGCFNEETWDFNGGQPYTPHTKWEIIESIGANGLQRNFSILGGEPLDPRNVEMVWDVVQAVRSAYPHITIYLWTGFQLDEVLRWPGNVYRNILNEIDIIIDGPFIEKQKSLDLNLRGSDNQHIWIKINGEWVMEE